MTLFEKIVAREIPANIIHETDLALAFEDINPQAPVHVLIIPKKPIVRIGEADDDDAALLGHLLLVARDVAAKLELTDNDKAGFRLVVNHGKNGGEAVPHLHIHLLGGRPLQWPPG